MSINKIAVLSSTRAHLTTLEEDVDGINTILHNIENQLLALNSQVGSIGDDVTASIDGLNCKKLDASGTGHLRAWLFV